MELVLLYVWMKLGALYTLICICAGVSLLCAVICAIAHVDYPKEGYWNLCKKWLISCTALVVISATIPTQNQVAVLVGTHYALELSKSPEGQKTVSIVRAKANSYLDEQLKGLVEENKPKKESK